MGQTAAKKVTVFTADDGTWLLPAWVAALHLLEKKFEVAGIFVFPDKLGGRSGFKSALWYLQVFGVWNFILFALFAIRSKFGLPAGSRSWQELAAKHQAPLIRAESPNDPDVVAWVRSHQVDVIVITFGHILKEAILAAPRAGIVNKHAGFLPCCRGVYPYFWARLHGLPTGLTFHEVDAGIDTGRILAQTHYPKEGDRSMSMLRFYMDVFHVFPEAVVSAVERLLERRYQAADERLKPCYFSLPVRADYLRFRRGGHRIARWSDLWHVSRLRAADAGL